jgi:hypothetical protein
LGSQAGPGKKCETHLKKNDLKVKRAESITQVVESLPSNYKALISNTTNTKILWETGGENN